MLRDYQQRAVDHCLEWAATAKPGDRLLMASPTGTGKSYMELALQERLGNAVLITPRVEILAGLLEKKGVQTNLSLAKLVEIGAEHKIFTPVRYRSLLLAGEVSAPGVMILDEAHHDLASTWQDLSLLCGCPPAIGFTATPFRGTPKGTAEFRKVWGEPTWVLTFSQAARAGVLAMPSCSTVPLVDDDLINISNGELVAREVESATMSRLDAIVELIQGMGPERIGVDGNGKEGKGLDGKGFFDMPTMASLPSRDSCFALHEALKHVGIPASVVTGDTPHADRRKAFEDCNDSRALLIQISVVSEGVDLPIRRLIDCSPTLSPVMWVQRLGRITRPGDRQPEYLSANRNLLRHGYLLDGCLPSAAMAQAQAAFPESQRSGLRAVGLEALGRLKPVTLPMANGLKGLAYSICASQDHIRTDYFVLVHPLREDPIWATRDTIRTEGEEIAYGRWRRCEPPADLAGYASLPPTPLSEKQAAWWKRSAKNFGLDPEAKITKKEFPALPVLADLKVRLT